MAVQPNLNQHQVFNLTPIQLQECYLLEIELPGVYALVATGSPSTYSLQEPLQYFWMQ